MFLLICITDWAVLPVCLLGFLWNYAHAQFFKVFWTFCNHWHSVMCLSVFEVLGFFFVSFLLSCKLFWADFNDTLYSLIYFWNITYELTYTVRVKGIQNKNVWYSVFINRLLHNYDAHTWTRINFALFHRFLDQIPDKCLISSFSL